MPASDELRQSGIGVDRLPPCRKTGRVPDGHRTAPSGARQRHGLPNETACSFHLKLVPSKRAGYRSPTVGGVEASTHVAAGPERTRCAQARLPGFRWRDDSAASWVFVSCSRAIGGQRPESTGACARGQQTTESFRTPNPSRRFPSTGRDGGKKRAGRVSQHRRQAVERDHKYIVLTAQDSTSSNEAQYRQRTVAAPSSPAP